MTRQPQSIAWRGAVWMQVDGHDLGNPRHMALLASIADQGSISQAARAIGMSYKAAWEAIDTLNQLAGQPLVERTTGGRGGGGTRLTERGQRLLNHFAIIEREHQRFLQALSEHADDITPDYQLLRRMRMKTSARNQFIGRISAIRTGAVNDEVHLALPGGQTLVATITRDSVDQLGLKEGSEAFALVKASSIMLVTDTAGARFSARNCLAGTVSRVHPGAVNTEIVLDVGAGNSIAAIITRESASRLGLEEGSAATALFKASSVIVGVPG